MSTKISQQANSAARKYLCGTCPHTPYSVEEIENDVRDLAALIQYAIDAHNAAQWRPVSEKPTIDLPVLCLTEYGFKVGCWSVECWIECQEMLTIYPTHWRELPPAPQTEEGK